MAKSRIINRPVSPALPQATVEYQRQYQDQLNNVLRIYFNQLDNATNAITSDLAGGSLLYFPHGAFVSTTSQTMPTADSARLISFPDTLAGTEIIGMSVVNGNRVLFEYAGAYQISVNLHVRSTSAADKDVTVWLRKNGVDIPNSARRETLRGVGSSIIEYTLSVELAALSYIEVVWAANNSNVELTATAANAPYPAVPSAIVNIEQKSNVLLE